MVRSLRLFERGRKASGIIIAPPAFPVTQGIVCIIDLLELACAGGPGGVIDSDTVRVVFERRSNTRLEGMIVGL